MMFCSRCLQSKIFADIKSQIYSGSVRRMVTTWTPLGTAFNAKHKRKFKFRGKNVGLFEMPELTSPAGFAVAQQKSLDDAEELVQAAISSPTGPEIITIFDKLSDALCRIADLADFIRVSHPDEAYANAAQETCMAVSATVEKLNTNVELHQSLRRLLDDTDVMNGMDEETRRVGELFMFDFEQSGIHLSETKREEFVKLNEDVMVLGTKFLQGTQQPVVIGKKHIPEHLRYSFNVDGNHVQINSLFADNPDDMVREAAYKIFLYPNPDQSQTLDSLLTARHRLANVVGFSSFSQRTLRGMMAQTPETVMKFLQSTSEKIADSVSTEIDILKEAKKLHNPSSSELDIWDTNFLMQQVKNKRYKVNPVEYMPYFSLGACMEGLNLIFQNLYDITLENVDPGRGELWSDDVQKLAVKHKEEGILGYIYCDFFERHRKPQQDCHFTVRCGRLLDDGSYQLPKVVLACSFPSADYGTPTLLTHGMMENLFHEFGHAMHSMLGRTRFQHVTGTRCATDFAEVPSILMEYFANDYRILRQFARHYKTQETLPEEMISNLCSSKKMFSAYNLQNQVCYAIMDQLYHGPHPLPKSTTDIYEEVQCKYSSIPHVPNTSWQLRFGHLVGYGAKYYSYLYSRAVANRIWSTCFKPDPFSREMGERYRRTMLAHGGGKEPSVLVENMLGQKLTTENLVESLINEVNES